MPRFSFPTRCPFLGNKTLLQVLTSPLLSCAPLPQAGGSLLLLSHCLPRTGETLGAFEFSYTSMAGPWSVLS